MKKFLATLLLVVNSFNHGSFGVETTHAQAPWQQCGAALAIIPYDVDAQAFFTAVISSGGSLSATEKSAVNALVKGLKTDGLWTTFHAIYPMVGGSSTSCKFNLKDPRDLDAAFRITYHGTWTFTSTGAKPGGSSSDYGDTHLIPSSVLSQNAASLGYCSRTSSTVLAQPIGSAGPTSFANRFEIAYNSGLYGILNTNNTSGVNSAIANTLGLMSATRKDANTIYVVKNGSVIVTNTSNASTGLSGYSIYIGAENNAGTVSLPSTWEADFIFVGDYFTTSQLASLDTRVSTFNTTLSR